MAISLSDLVSIRAAKVAPPPAWALLQRQLMGLLEQAGDLATQKYARPDGLVYHIFDVDDAYESRSMRGMFYALGGARRFLDIARREYDAITWLYSDERTLPQGDPPHPMYMAQLHNEYWNLAVPFNADWFHMGEGNQMFYDFGVADPTHPTSRERARKFAAMYIGEDPQAPNWDAAHKIIRSPLHGGAGPFLSARQHQSMLHTSGEISDHVHLVRHWLDRGSMGDFGHRNKLEDKPSDTSLTNTFLYPAVKELEPRWYENPERREEIIDLFDKMILQGDEPANLCTTALVANAYLYTGDEKYRKWVLDYVGAWIERIRANGGIIPDNVGPNGAIGETRQGQWWGGLHGWNSSPRAIDRIFLGLIIGAECATLLSGDAQYLELLRSQIDLLLDQARTDENGQLLVPGSYGPDGWENYGEMSVRGGPIHLTHLWNTSMSKQDYDRIARVREGDKTNDWNEIPSVGDRGGARTEYARFQFYDGRKPNWPLEALRADYEQVVRYHEAMQNDNRTVKQIIAGNFWPPNPVVIKSLVQTTMGSPQALYNGGILRATVRYFDADQGRPGLPQDVAALVDDLGPEHAGVQLVNLSSDQTRRLIVQAGAFGEHAFTGVEYEEHTLQVDSHNPTLRIRTDYTGADQAAAVEGKYFAVELPPMTSIRLRCGMRRFANDPSYAFPWHGDRVPVE